MTLTRWTRRGLTAVALVATLAACAPAPGGGGGAGGPEINGAPCAGTTGVTVVVDFGALDDRIEIRCAPGPQASGLTALAATGFVTTDESGPGTICTIDSLPTEGYPYCWLTGGYWGYYESDGTGPWDYSLQGAGDGPLVEGSVYGWAWAPEFVGEYPRVDPTAL